MRSCGCEFLSDGEIEERPASLPASGEQNDGHGNAVPLQILRVLRELSEGSFVGVGGYFG